MSRPTRIDDGERLLLFDPIAPPSELEGSRPNASPRSCSRARGTSVTHRRLVERLGAPVYTPLPDTAEYLMETYGLTAEQAGDGSPDVVWLLKEGDRRGACTRPATDWTSASRRSRHKPNDMVLWIESHRSVIAGDTLVDFGRGLEINAVAART